MERRDDNPVIVEDKDEDRDDLGGDEIVVTPDPNANIDESDDELDLNEGLK
jgi:hypothetical protein